MYHLVRCLFSGAPEKVEKVSGDNEGGRKKEPSAVDQGGQQQTPRHLTLMTLGPLLQFSQFILLPRCKPGKRFLCH